LDDLKQERNDYKNTIMKLKKAAEEIKKRNNDKSEVLRSIRNFLVTSTINKTMSSENEIENENNKN